MSMFGCLYFMQMGKTDDNPTQKKARIDVYITEMTLSQQEIAKKVGVSQQAVSRLSRKLAFGLPVVSQLTGELWTKTKITCQR